MARAAVKTTTQIVGVTLELTLEEADYVRLLTGRAVGGYCRGIYSELVNLALPQAFTSVDTISVERA